MIFRPVRTAMSLMRLMMSLRTAWSTGLTAFWRDLTESMKFWSWRGLFRRCTSPGPIFSFNSDLGSASMPPRQIRTQPSGPMNFVESPPGLNVISTPPAMCSFMSQL